MENQFFHLDGVGEIPHLKHLLEIPNLKVIQWQPGAGKEEIKQWYELIEKILDGGKAVQLYAKASEVEDAVKQLGAKGLPFVISDATKKNMEMLSKKYPIAIHIL